MATHSSTLAWKTPWMTEPTVTGIVNGRTRLSDFTFNFQGNKTCLWTILGKNLLKPRLYINQGTISRTQPGFQQVFTPVMKSWARIKLLFKSTFFSR